MHPAAPELFQLARNASARADGVIETLCEALGGTLGVLGFGCGAEVRCCRMAQSHVIYNQMVVDRLADVTADRIFQALGAATRRDILARAIRQEQSVSALARNYEMSLAAVQKHVAVLERAALVTKQRRGREQIVSANAPTLHRAVALLDAYEQMWIERTTRIADILAGEEGSTT